jgi:hypothetical protein
MLKSYLLFFCRYSPAEKEIEKRILFNVYINPKYTFRTSRTIMKDKNLSQVRCETFLRSNKTGVNIIDSLISDNKQIKGKNMKSKKGMTPSIPTAIKSNSKGDDKLNKLSDTSTDLYELRIGGKIFYSEYKDSFEVDLNQIKAASVKDLPGNVEINFVNSELKYKGSIVTEEISTISILHLKDEKCRISFQLNISPDNGHSTIMAILFQLLKNEVILLRKKMNPAIEDDYEHYLNYSIDVKGVTIEGLITTAVAINESISKEIEDAIDKTPRFLADYLGIAKSEDLFNSLENFQTI